MMRHALLVIALLGVVHPALAQEEAEPPSENPSGEGDQSEAAQSDAQLEDDGAEEDGEPALVPPELLSSGDPPQVLGYGGRVRFTIEISEEGTVRDSALESVTIDDAAPEDQRPTLEGTLAAVARAYLDSLRFSPAHRGDEAFAVRVAFDVVVSAIPLPERPEEEAPEDAVDPATSDERAGNEVPDEDELEDEGPAFGATGAVDAPVRERSGASAGDFDVDIGELRRVPRVGAQSMLTLVPGVLLTQHANEGHAMGIFLRGFDAGEGEDLEVLVDGMPINEISNAHGHGYVDTLFAIPEVVDSLRVVQGPFDPAQGDFATAGTAEYRLGVRERGVHLSLGYGRFDEVRFSGVWAPSGAEDGTFVALSYNQGDGFGPNRSFRNGAAIGRYEGVAGDFRYHLMAFAATGTWRSAGVLRADDFSRRAIDGCGTSRDEQFFCFYDPNQGGSTQQAGLVGRLRYGENNRIVEMDVFGRTRALRIQENFTGFTADARTDGGPQRGDNLDQQYSASTIGARLRYRVARTFLDFAQRFEGGVQVRYDDAETANDRRRAALSIPYATDFDRRVQETLIGGYARAELRFLSWLRVIAGARMDFFGFQVRDQNFLDEDAVGERLERTSFSASGIALSPRGTVRATLTEGLDLVLAAGLGARSSDAAALSEAELAPFARITALEAGLAYDRTFGVTHVEGRASAFTTRVSQDLVFSPADGRNTLLGPSSRSGTLLQARVRWANYLDVMGSVTYTRAHLQGSDAAVFDLFNGPRLPFIPSWVGRLDVAGTLPLEVREESVILGAAAGVQFVGPRPLPLEQVAARFALVDIALSARWRFLELRAAVRNVLDTRYRSDELNYVSNFRDPALPPSMLAARHFSAGPPRTFLLTAAVHFDPRAGAARPAGEREGRDAESELDGERQP